MHLFFFCLCMEIPTCLCPMCLQLVACWLAPRILPTPVSLAYVFIRMGTYVTSAWIGDVRDPAALGVSTNIYNSDARLTSLKENFSL